MPRKCYYCKRSDRTEGEYNCHLTSCKWNLHQKDHFIPRGVSYRKSLENLEQLGDKKK